MKMSSAFASICVLFGMCVFTVIVLLSELTVNSESPAVYVLIVSVSVVFVSYW